jgi:hypothetical protein
MIRHSDHLGKTPRRIIETEIVIAGEMDHVPLGPRLIAEVGVSTPPRLFIERKLHRRPRPKRRGLCCACYSIAYYE